jgi:hypothetical protein
MKCNCVQTKWSRKYFDFTISIQLRSSGVLLENHSACQEIDHLWKNRKVQCRVHKNLPLYSVLSQINSIYIHLFNVTSIWMRSFHLSHSGNFLLSGLPTKMLLTKIYRPNYDEVNGHFTIHATDVEMWTRGCMFGVFQAVVSICIVSVLTKVNKVKFAYS